MEYARSRGILPTNMGSTELKGLEAAVRQRSFFSARTTNADYLQTVKDVVDRFLGGEINQATARAACQDALDALGYDSTQGGFPGDENVPPAAHGTLRDLASDKRTKLMLETNLRQAANFAYVKQSQTDQARWAYPCWELVRIYWRRVPRGFRVGKKGALEEMPGESWQERWVRAGGELVDGDRMIARIDDPVWQALGDSGIFPDGLDTPYPPFAFNSGYGLRGVPRAECVELGVIGENDEVAPDDGVEFTGELDVRSDRYDPSLMRALKAELGLENRRAWHAKPVRGLLAVLEALEGKAA